MSYENKSKPQLKELWTKSLADGVCWLDGCEITKSPCQHLNNYLSYSDSSYTDKDGKVQHREIQVVYTSDIDDYSITFQKSPTDGAWAFYKRIRKYGLDRDQVGLLVRKFALNMTHRQILEDMGWLSHKVLSVRLRKALQTLKGRGFGK